MANNLDRFTNVFGRSKFDKMVHKLGSTISFKRIKQRRGLLMWDFVNQGSKNIFIKLQV